MVGSFLEVSYLILLYIKSISAAAAVVASPEKYVSPEKSVSPEKCVSPEKSVSPEKCVSPGKFYTGYSIFKIFLKNFAFGTN